MWGGGRHTLGGRRTTGVRGYWEVVLSLLSAAVESVLGRNSIGLRERLREGEEEAEYVDVEGARCRRVEL